MKWITEKLKNQKGRHYMIRYEDRNEGKHDDDDADDGKSENQ